MCELRNPLGGTAHPHCLRLTVTGKTTNCRGEDDICRWWGYSQNIAGAARTKNNKKKILTIANPTSAFFNAGPSLVPSPVTATTCLWSTMVLSMIPKRNTHTHTHVKKHEQWFTSTNAQSTKSKGNYLERQQCQNKFSVNNCSNGGSMRKNITVKPLHL